MKYFFGNSEPALTQYIMNHRDKFNLFTELIIDFMRENMGLIDEKVEKIDMSQFEEYNKTILRKMTIKEYENLQIRKVIGSLLNNTSSDLFYNYLFERTTLLTPKDYYECYFQLSLDECVEVYYEILDECRPILK